MPKNAVTDWDASPPNNSDIAGINIAENCPPSGINDAIRTVMAQVAAYIGGGIATLADWCAGTATTKFFTPSSLLAAVAPQTIADSAAISVDLSTGLRFNLTKTGNGTMTFTNAKVGYTYQFAITQDATGNRTMTLIPPGGVTIKTKGSYSGLSTAAGSVDRMSVEIWSTTLYLVTLSKAYS